MSNYFAGSVCGVGIFTLILMAFDSTPKQITEKMQKEAISHGAAHYEVDTNGVVSFKWNK